MRKKSFVLALSLSLAFVLSFIGSGFALFYVGGTKTESKDVSPRVDQIEENYALADAGNSDSFYDVYFFCTPYAAFLGDNEDPLKVDLNQRTFSDTSSRNFAKTYFWDGALPEDADQQVNSSGNNGNNGWRHIRVYRSISSEQFTSIGTPRAGKGYTGDTSGNKARNYWDCDYNGWPLDFSGWTANKEAAMDCLTENQGDFYNQGNFEYVDVFSPLSSIDSLAKNDGSEISIDGSKKDDKVIYLYPIFSTGKSTKVSPLQASVRLSFHDEGSFPDEGQTNGHYFLAQNGLGNNAEYYYNNLVVDQDAVDNNKYSLEFTVLTWTGEGGKGGLLADNSGKDPTNDWHSVWEKVDLPLVKMPGIYNVKVRLFNQFYDYYDNNSQDYKELSAEEYADAVISNRLGNIKDEGVVVNHIIYASNNVEGVDSYSKTQRDKSYSTPKKGEDGQNQFLGSDGTTYTGLSPFVCLIQLERVYEFHLLGGQSATFDYDQTPYFYQGDIFPADYDNAQGRKRLTLGLNNVFFNASSSGWFHDTYVGESSGDNNREGNFRSNVFTVDFMNTIWPNSITSFSEEELQQINDFAETEYEEENPQYVSISDDGLLQKAKSKEEAPDNYDYELTNTENKTAYRTMLKITRSGYYNIRLQIFFKEDSNTTDTADLKSYIDEIKIAISPVQTHYFVKIFKNNSFNYHAGQLNQGSGDSIFVTHDSDLPNGNELVAILKFDEFGMTLNGESKFFTDANHDGKIDIETGEGEKTLAKIRNENGGNLYDFVTGITVPDRLILQKNYIFCLDYVQQ